MSHYRLLLVALIDTTLAAACGGGNSSGPPPRTLQAFGGAPQSDTVLSTLANPLVVLARENADPLPGVTVTWTAAGDGKVNGSGTATTTTGADGKASVTYQLGSTAGQQTPTAAATGLGGSPVSFALTATAGVATEIARTAGDGGSALINSQVTYTVIARDSHGNPKPGVPIDWAVTSGGGSITPAQSITGTNGTTNATRTLSGTQGTHTATATANGITGMPSVTFTTTAITAPAAASVSVGNNFFSPESVTIAAGGRVTWSWSVGSVTHNVTFDSPGSPSSIGNMSAGSDFRDFPTAGTYNYHCTIHGSAMSGSVTVAP